MARGRKRTEEKAAIGTVYVPVREIAARIGLSEPRTYALIAEGAIPALHDGRRIRVPRTAFERWLDERAELALSNVKRSAAT
jgi:excisionase family DNA binding protein